ncbi:terminal hydrolase 22 [Seminavis robusta]|uniref:ubiquitinyl hydrolase 1 n=1 Tax=Seminavis robusta TaxID=568900 RepID=A0A9N8DC83_9STRA|nr:terminal hydrolase 22 [Seminavis robusta]|eukprot:Sro26_g017680.1 terminal hydrolase 22 (1148) ;mRNA; r:95436-99295
MSQSSSSNNTIKQPPPRTAMLWRIEAKLKRPAAVEEASIRMKETCDAPSGFCDLLLSESCQCPHLERWLPNMLELDFCKNATGLKTQPLRLLNPVHSLHLSSQLEENSTVVEIQRNSKSSPWMYGEEQQRTVAFSQAGIPERFFPLTKKHVVHEFNTPNPHAPKPIHATSTAAYPSNNNTDSKAEATTSAASSPSKATDQPTDGVASSAATSPAISSPAKPASSASQSTSVSFASPVAEVKTMQVDSPQSAASSPKANKGNKKDQEGTKDHTTSTTTGGKGKLKDKENETKLQDASGKDDAATGGDVEMKDATATNKKDPNSGKGSGKKQPAVRPGGTKTDGTGKDSSSSEHGGSEQKAKKHNMGKQPPKPINTSGPTHSSSPSNQASPSSTPTGATSSSAMVKKSEEATASGATAATSSTNKPEYHLSEARFLELSRQEEQVQIIRSLLAKRYGNTKKKSKKRKLEAQFSGTSNSALQNLPGASQYTDERPITVIDAAEQQRWMKEKEAARLTVERWLDQFRASRRAYIKEEASARKKSSTETAEKWSTAETTRRTCQLCPANKSWQFSGDEILQCLECSFIGCGPASVAPESKHQHILQHLFLSGHKFAVSCGARAQVFCFPCGDFVYHRVFDQERERLDLESKIPWLAWSDHPLMRGFSPLEFAHVEEYGIIWRGVKATYPALVPDEHTETVRLCMIRQAVFEGKVWDTEWSLLGRRTLDYMIDQNKKASAERWKITAPVGMFNLGNTCFMTAILQCLIHCIPLQRYFLKDIGHHHAACEKYRHVDPSDKAKVTDNVCLACEMDSLMLEYYGRSRGRDVVGILNDLSARPRRGVVELFNEISSMDEEKMASQGMPLLPTKMLLAAWKSGGMDHLKGYQQRDSHEFLLAFLEILGKQICKHRARVDEAIAMAQLGNPFRKPQEPVHHDVVKHLFEGTLRSVLVCQECGNKRTLSEPFLNVSLPLLNEIMSSQIPSAASVPNASGSQLNVDRCLQHFTAPEKLSDPVDCPSCNKKTPTQKQHTFSRLPRVLCVHLKRFHPALNKKIEDFVEFPARGLNMGPHLPHWREVTTVPSKGEPNESSSEPSVLYDLFGTVNHRGNLQSGHYFSNVQVQGRWFCCNDQHVSGTDEAAVLASDGAYILFYTRR